jgi:hypothetical protein
MNKELLSISEAAAFLGISEDTLRRWDKSGRFKSFRENAASHRRYRLSALETFAGAHCVEMAKKWAGQTKGDKPNDLFYCPDSYVFQGRLYKLKSSLAKISGESTLDSLIIAMAGEIGDNSFAHNLGNWPDIVGIFFGFDPEARAIVLADRGQGIFRTLHRVRPELENDRDALRVAFTEIVSGRAPESRGNGLKYIRGLIEDNPIGLFFQSGEAGLDLNKYGHDIRIKTAKSPVKGCLAVIKF